MLQAFTTTEMRLRSFVLHPSSPEAELDLHLCRTYSKASETLGKALCFHFFIGSLLASIQETWLLLFSLGGLAVTLFYGSRIVFSNSFLTRSLAGVGLQLFTLCFLLQYPQGSGLSSFYFTGLALLVIYRDPNCLLPAFGVYLVGDFLLSYSTAREGQDILSLSTILGYGGVSFHFCLCYFTSSLLRQEAQRDLRSMRELARKSIALEEATAISDEAALRSKELAEKAEAASRAKSDFLARMSHDLRTPLHGILGLTRILQESSVTSDQLDSLTLIEGSADSLLEIVNDILDLSKIEVGKMELLYEPMSLRKSVEKIVACLGTRAAQKNIVLTSNLQEEIPLWILGDALRTEQVIMNLVGNAIKFTPCNGEVCVQVRALRTVNQHCMLEITVSDTGVGIEGGKISKMFEAFQQADVRTAREFGGTGLGLAICHRLVTLMGGEIGIESRPGVGSRFWFTLPATISEAPILDAQPLPVPGSLSLPNVKILLVEDNVVNQRIALTLLTKLGADVTVANNGKEALELFDKDEFQIICMDCQMPIMDGFQATARIRRKERQKATSVKILALTANAMDGDRDRCLAAGMDAYLPKPFTYRKLRESIERLVTSPGNDKPDTN